MDYRSDRLYIEFIELPRLGSHLARKSIADFTVRQVYNLEDSSTSRYIGYYYLLSFLQKY